MLTRLGPCRTPFLLLAIFLLLFSFLTKPAFAVQSMGCASVNIGSLNSGPIPAPVTYTQFDGNTFAPGETITVVFSDDTGNFSPDTFSLSSSLNGVVDTHAEHPFPGNGTSNQIVLSLADNSVTVTVSGTGSGFGTYSVTASCTPASTPAPTVTSISPTSGPTTGGTSVVITGTNLSGATGVTIGGVAATGLTANTATSITVTTPAGSAGTASVLVTTPGGTNAANSLFTYVTPAPTVTSVNPNTGPTTGGTSVTITGTNLTGATSVKFGSTNATSFTVNSATQITATSPAGALGTVHVTVTTPGGTSATSAADQFTYGVPADSLKLRAMQVSVTPVIAQISGQAISGAIDDAIEAGFSDNVQPLTPNGSGFTFNFGAEGNEQGKVAASNNVHDFIAAPNRRASRVDDAFSALAYDGNISKAPPRLTAPQRDWLGWIDVRGTSVDRRSIGNDLKGDQINATAGLTRKLTPDFLIGAFGGYEHFDYSSDALTGRLKGDGWTVGSYLGWRFTPTMRFDLALARSAIDFNGMAGTASATFPGSRWLVSSGLTGTYRWQALVFQPSARIYALWEHENGYTDSLGTVQTDRHFSSGRASAGAKLSYPFAWTSTIALAPYAGLYGDYYFTSDDATSTGLASTPLLQGWSARFTSGLAMKSQGGGQLSFGGELGGIGGNTTILTWRARGSVPF